MITSLFKPTVDMIFDWCLKVFILGCMLFYIPGIQFYIPQTMYFQYGGMLIFLFCFLKSSKRDVKNPYLFAVFLYAAVATVLGSFTPQSRLQLLNFFIGFVLVKSLADRISLDLKWIGGFLAGFAAWNVIWLILQMYNIDPVFSSVAPGNMPQTDHVGMLALKSNLGVYAALAFPFIWAYSPWASIIVIPLLWFGQSSTAVAAVLVTFLFILWNKNKRIFYASLGACTALGIWYVFKIDAPSGQFLKRFWVWLAGIRYLSASNPWFGNGLGSWGALKFSTIQDNGAAQVWVWAHNEFLQYSFELGIFGFLTLYAYITNFFKRINLAIKDHRDAVTIMIPILITSFVHFPFHLGKFCGLLCYMLALTEALLHQEPVSRETEPMRLNERWAEITPNLNGGFIGAKS